MLEYVYFVLGYLFVGIEYLGLDVGFVGFFVGCWCILMFVFDIDVGVIVWFCDFWNVFGFKVEEMDLVYYDKVFVIVLYFLYIIVYNIVGMVDDLEMVMELEVIKYLVFGFCDFMCLVLFDLMMWWDVCLYNKDVILEMLVCFFEDFVYL